MDRIEYVCVYVENCEYIMYVKLWALGTGLWVFIVFVYASMHGAYACVGERQVKIVQQQHK